MFPREELDRIDTKILDQYYKPSEVAEDGYLILDEEDNDER